MSKNYKAAITSTLLWVQESRKTAEYIVQGLSRAELCALSRNDNIYMAPSDDRKRRIASVTYDRIMTLPKELQQLLSTCDLDTAKQIVLLSVMLNDDLFHDFMVEVYKEKIILGEKTLVNNDVRIYLDNKRLTYESVQKISEVSLKKIAQTYVKFLLEAGLLNNRKECIIQYQYVDATLEDILRKYSFNDYLFMLMGG
ncbi:MAG: DUF1819 family protein [Erysipelotrichaceae bacterium]|nr:DUF1819 family protein [Erysipelotrichaceae bacterium]